MAKFFSKIKDPKHHFAIAIKKNYDAGMRPKDIAKLFNLSKQRVNYWLHHEVSNKRKKEKNLLEMKDQSFLNGQRISPLTWLLQEKYNKSLIDSQKIKKKNGFKKKFPCPQRTKC